MTRRIVFSLLLTVLLPTVFLVEAQQAKVYRVGSSTRADRIVR